MKKHLHVLSLMLLAVLAVSVTGCSKMSDGGPPPVTDLFEGMVLIPAGEFRMGSDSGWPDEKPIHSVYVDAFYMDAYEVTNAEYAAFLNAQGRHVNVRQEWYDIEYEGTQIVSVDGDYRVQRLWYDIEDEDARIMSVDGVYRVQSGYEHHPVVAVSWYGAMAYAAWVGKRLPTEAEWEKAARGSLSGQKYPWGNTIDSSRANYSNYSGTTVVGKYPSNRYGLYDMAGNVWEWCLDEWNSEFYAISPARNPLSGTPSIKWLLDNYTDVGSNRVVRGGCWNFIAEDARVARRHFDSPAVSRVLLGFRCARAVTP